MKSSLYVYHPKTTNIMKKLITILCLTYCISAINTLYAQDSADDLSEYSLSFLTNKNKTFNSAEENRLNSIDSIPDFQIKEEKIKITGTIYQADGITPAKNVVLYIYQPDEDGNYDMRKDGDKRNVYHQASIKTGTDGTYTFYTFIPGIVHRSGALKHIHPVIKEEGKAKYDLNSFHFDNDPLLTKYRYKRLVKKGRDKSVLKLEKKDDMFLANRDIILGEDISDCK